MLELITLIGLALTLGGFIYYSEHKKDTAFIIRNKIVCPKNSD